MGYGRLLRETRPTAELPRGACTLLSIDAREYVTRDVINSHNSHRRFSESNSQRARMILLALLDVSFASFYLCFFLLLSRSMIKEACTRPSMQECIDTCRSITDRK